MTQELNKGKFSEIDQLLQDQDPNKQAEGLKTLRIRYAGNSEALAQIDAHEQSNSLK